MSGFSVISEFCSAFFSGAYQFLTEPIVSAELIVLGCLIAAITLCGFIDDHRTDDVFAYTGVSLLFLGALFMVVLMVWWLVQYGT